MLERIKEIYAYREMTASLVRRDLKGRYKGSVLGFLWTFLNPLLQLAVYTMVFSTIMRSGIEDYYLFLFVALIPWIFFSTSLTGGAGCILSQQDMVKKIYFPRGPSFGPAKNWPPGSRLRLRSCDGRPPLAGIAPQEKLLSILFPAYMED